MGKRYYCDYCDKTMSSAPSIIKTHINGLLHQKVMKEHYQQFKEPETILAEESKKKPCARFPKGECTYGTVCRFSHYSWEALESLKKYVETKRLAISIGTQPCFQDLYNQLQTEKSSKTQNDHNTVLVNADGVTHVLPWTYNNVLDTYDVPPSVKRLRVEHFSSAKFCEWG